MLHLILNWIKESSGSYLGFLTVILLISTSLVLFRARISNIFNIRNMPFRRPGRLFLIPILVVPFYQAQKVFLMTVEKGF